MIDFTDAVEICRPATVKALPFGDCDCCQKPNRVLHHCWAHGTETAACAECQGNPLSDDIDDLQDEIDRLRPLAETAEQWAAHRIGALESAVDEAEGLRTCRG